MSSYVGLSHLCVISASHHMRRSYRRVLLGDVTRVSRNGADHSSTRDGLAPVARLSFAEERLFPRESCRVIHVGVSSWLFSGYLAGTWWLPDSRARSCSVETIELCGLRRRGGRSPDNGVAAYRFLARDTAAGRMASTARLMTDRRGW